MAGKPHASLESIASGKMAPTLTPTKQFAGKPEVPLSRTITLIGSGTGARLQLISSTVSKSHALIVNCDNGPYVRDLASRTKVIVNGQEAREAVLKQGDTLQFGRFSFIFNEPPGGSKPSPGQSPPLAQMQVTGVDSPVTMSERCLLVGRRDTCDIVIADEEVSTAHAAICDMDGKRFIRDLGSRTGTFVNGNQIHQAELEFGDIVRIGRVELKYEASREQLDKVSLDADHEQLAPVGGGEQAPAAAPPTSEIAAEQEPDLAEEPWERAAAEEAPETSPPTPSADEELPAATGVSPADEIPLEPIEVEPQAPEPLHVAGAEDQPTEETNVEMPVDQEHAPEEHFDKSVDRAPTSPRREPLAEQAPVAPALEPIELEPLPVEQSPAEADTEPNQPDASQPITEAPAKISIKYDHSPPESEGEANPTRQQRTSDQQMEFAERPDDLPQTLPSPEVSEVPINVARSAGPAEGASHEAQTAEPFIELAPADDQLVAGHREQQVPEKGVASNEQEPTPAADKPPGFRSEQQTSIFQGPPQVDPAATKARPGEETSELTFDLPRQTSTHAASPEPPADEQTSELDMSAEPLNFAPPSSDAPPLELEDFPPDAPLSLDASPESSGDELSFDAGGSEGETDGAVALPLKNTAPTLDLAPSPPPHPDLQRPEGPRKPPEYVERAKPPVAPPTEPPTHLPPLNEPAVDQPAMMGQPESVDSNEDVSRPAMDQPPASPVEIISKTEPEPSVAMEIGQGLSDVDVAPESVSPVREEPDLTDTRFNRAIEEFTHDATTGPLVEESKGQPTHAPPAHLDDGSGLGLNENLALPPEATTPPVQEEKPAYDSQDSLAESLDLSEPVQSPPDRELPAPDVPDTLPQIPAPESPPAIPEHATSPQPVSEAPAQGPGEPVSPAPATATPLSQAPVPPSWGANQEHFFGGLPLQLQKGSSGAAPPPLVAQSPPSTKRPSTGQVSALSPPRAKPPGPPHQRPTPKPRGVAGSMGLVSPPSQGPAPKRIVTGFDGLAAPPGRQVDIFSQMPVSAAGDAIATFGPTDVFAEPNDASSRATSKQAPPHSDVPREEPAAQTESEPSPETPPPPQAPPDAHDEVVPPPPPPTKKKHRWFKLWLLLLLMVLSVGATVAGTWYLLPNRVRVTGRLHFDNFNNLTQLDRHRLADAQQALLASAEVRKDARELLTKSSPHVSTGFLDSPFGFGSAVAGAKLDLDTGVLTVQYVGSDPQDERARMLALMTALYDGNHGLTDQAVALRKEISRLRESQQRKQQELNQIKTNLDQCRQAALGRPDSDEMTRLQSQATRLKSAYDNAVATVHKISSDIDELKNGAATRKSNPLAVNAPIVDVQLAQYQSERDTLVRRIATVNKMRAADAADARRAFDAAVAAFQEKVKDARPSLKKSPELTKYVDAAQALLDSSREVTDQHLRREHTEYAQLGKLESQLREKTAVARGDAMKRDPKLRQYYQQQELKTHQYNAAMAAGYTSQANDLKADLSLLDEMIKARQTQIGDDQLYADAITQLQQIIGKTKKNIDADHKEAADMLQQLRLAFVASQPTTQKLPSDRKALVADLTSRLASAQEAQRRYAEAAELAIAQADPDLRQMQQNADALAEKIAERQRQLAARQDANDQLLTQEQQKLADAQRAQRNAEAAYAGARDKLADAQSRLTAARQAGKQRDALKVLYDRRVKSLDQSSKQLEFDRRLAALRAVPVPPTKADITIVNQTRRWQRLPYILAGAGGMMALCIGLIVLNVAGGRRSVRTAPFARPADRLAASPGEPDEHRASIDEDLEGTSGDIHSDGAPISGGNAVG